jgi:hypothetical protein
MKDIDAKKYTSTDGEQKQIKQNDAENHTSSLLLYLQKDLLSELPKYPKNDSISTKEELHRAYLMQNNSSKSEIQFAKNMHNMQNIYKLWSAICKKKYDFDLPPQFFLECANQTKSLISHIKKHFNRPRPYQLAEHFRLLNKTFVDTKYLSSSYPSGHACEAYMFCYILSQQMPHESSNLENVAEKIAQSRIRAGVHLHSDIECGRLLAKQIISHNLCNYNF